MGSIQLKPDEHLDVILQNPSSVVSKEGELSESTYPLLAAYYQWIRKINGIHTKLDVVIQNEQILSEFIYLCEHNLLFFLTVTGRFDVIRELFIPHKLTPRERYLIQLIQREYAQAHQRLESTLLKVNKEESKKEESLILEDWKKYANGLSNMDFYFYYDQEIKRISYEYNLKQIQLLSQAYDSRYARLHQAINIIRADNNISDEVKREAELLYEKYSNIRSSLPDYTRSINLQEQERNYQLRKQIYEDSEEIPEFFKKHKHLNNEFSKLLQEDKKQDKIMRKQLAANEKKYNENMKVLISHKENVRKAAHNDVDNSIHHIIHFIDKCPKNNLNAEQKEVLNEAVHQLKEYKEKVKRTKNFEETQNVLKECSGELKKIEAILKPHLPQHALKVFLKEIELFNEGIIDRRKPIPEGQLIFDPPSMPVHQESVAVENESPSTPTSNVPINIDKKEQIESQIKETTVVIEEALHNITLFKSELQIMRAEKELITLVEEEEQQSYKAEINKLQKALQKNKEGDSFNPDDLPQIEAAEELIGKLKTIGFEKVNINHLKSLYYQIDNLSGQYENLGDSKEQLDELLDSLTDNLQNNAQI